jgi:hypothetical protein
MNRDRGYLNNLLDAFLADRSKSRGGYAPVDQHDGQKLADIFRLILELKYDRDPDGALPIELDIVDRTRFQRMHFFKLQNIDMFDPDEVSEIQIMEGLGLRSANAKMATGELDTYIQLMNYREHEKKRRTK